MAKDLEAEVEKGRAVKDTIESDGWGFIETKIKEEIEDERIALRDVEVKDAFTMLAEFMDHQKKMVGLERVFEIIKEFLISKENAENKLKGGKSE